MKKLILKFSVSIILLGWFLWRVNRHDLLTRSGLSIPSNIAEGYERESSKETANFLNYAKGSAGELRTQIYIGMDIGYIDREAGMQWIKEVEEISRMLHGLMQSFKNS